MESLRKPKIITIGGGKGGVGKSLVAAGIGCQLANLTKKVVLLDADLGGANLHLNLGVRHPEKTLNDFINSPSANISEILIPTAYKDVQLISGAGSIYELSDPNFTQKRKLLKSLNTIDADYLIVDVGAGSTEDNTDFFTISDNGVVVITNEPSSIENAYTFLKNCVIRKLLKLFTINRKVKELIQRYSSSNTKGHHSVGKIIQLINDMEPLSAQLAISALEKFRPRVVVNMVKTSADIQVEVTFRKIISKFLNIEPIYVGHLVYHDIVDQSIKQITPLSNYAGTYPVNCLKTITNNILSLNN